jgi:tetratricopeptide (TPR) repeat protein
MGLMAATAWLAPAMAVTPGVDSSRQKGEADSAASLARQALDMCDAVADVPVGNDRPQLERGLALAERAAAMDDRNAKAHLAVFCNLAKLTYLDGFRLRGLLTVWRLRREIDMAQELAPDDADILIAKGGFLLNLPGLLGGDAREAERLLRRAVELAPERVLPRLYLAEALLEMGAREQARIQAEHALTLALRAGRAEQAEEARTLIARLDQ